jgi:hypothetical protein
VVGLLGFVALLFVLGDWAGREERLRQITFARRVQVEEDGTLVFLDGALPRTADSASLLPIGPATALHVVSRAQPDETPFRGSTRECWFALPGRRDDNRAAESRRIGRTQALLALLIVSSVGAITFAVLR